MNSKNQPPDSEDVQGLADVCLSVGGGGSKLPPCDFGRNMNLDRKPEVNPAFHKGECGPGIVYIDFWGTWRWDISQNK